MIEFHSTQIRGTVQVVLTSGAEVRVEHSGDVPTYRLTPQGVIIDNSASQPNYVLQIPRAAQRVVVRIASDTVFLKNRDRLTTAATPDGPDAYILAFSTVTAKAK